ncbi:MAG: 1-acyl-sn-glycerol-3-phosphate acyltransferase [Lachnospiraceae bacterium]|nr:1-acyl-sn-glycerol-3-phosphate acyltransferase [Lachnospiraceae bacterium]
MKRIIWMMLMNLVHVPRVLVQLLRRAAHPERYTMEQRYATIHEIAERGIKGGRVDVVSTGLEKLPKEGGYILYPNHQGLFDVMVLIDLHEQPISVVLKQELTKIPLLKQIIQCLGALALDRSDARQGLQVVLQVAEDVKKGGKYIIFAEGTRSRDGNKVQEFKGGSFKSATKAKCPIIPVALIDSYKAMDTGSIERVTVQAHFLDPIPYEEYKGMKTTQIAAEVRRRIEEKIAVESGEQIEEKSMAAGD